MQRLGRINFLFSGQTKKKQTTPEKKTAKLTQTRVWENMNIDQKMSARAVEKRKETQKFMEGIEERLIPHINATTWPEWVFPELVKLGINGLTCKDFGGPGLSTLEAGSIIFELAKIDGSVAMAFLV